jgi:hypothetical protein
LFIETGKLTVKHIIKMRRVMYWWHLVNLDKNEVLHKFYIAQKLNRSKEDWVEQLEKDKVDLDLQLEDEEIKCFKREQFRNIVKNRLEKFAAKYLLQLKKSHSKTEHLQFNRFQTCWICWLNIYQYVTMF